MKFIADVMVGRLARWLRILGFDVVYSNHYDDDAILRIAQTEDRIILTRDTRLAARPDPARCLLIHSGDYREQVRQVTRHFDLKEFLPFSRCLECNVRLIDTDKESVFERIPPYIYLTQERFAICPSCRRVYWHGTHAEEMLKEIRRGTL
jgi:hypothetical protein